MSGRPIVAHRKLANTDELIHIGMPMLTKHGVLGPQGDRLSRGVARPPVLFRWGSVVAVRAQLEAGRLHLTPEHGVLAEPVVIHFIPEHFGQDHTRLRLWLECPLCAGRARYLYAVPAALVELAPQLLRHRAFACKRCHDLREASHRRITHERRWKRHADLLAEQLGPDPTIIPCGTGDQPVRRARHVAKQRRYAAVLKKLNGVEVVRKA